MENASKALIMAAGVLIGIMVISIGVFLFTSFRGFAREKYEDKQQQQIIQFNSQFTSYQSKECSIYDVITLANLATENNKFYEYEERNIDSDGSDSYITVKLIDTETRRLEYGKSNSNSEMESENNELIKKYNTTNEEDDYLIPKFKIKEIKISTQTHKVYMVVFERI